METKSPVEIAAAIGAPVADLLGTQDWQSNLYPAILVSELHYANDGGCIPFRLKNSVTGEVFSKIPDEAAPGDVDGLFNQMCQSHREVELSLKPALYAAVPDLDPEAAIIRGLNVGGKEMIADVVGGQVANLRAAPGQVKFSINGAGAVDVDLSSLSREHQDLALAAVDAVSVNAVALPKG